MIQLHYSNRLEALIAPLAQALITAQRADPLKSGVVIVPNLVYAEFLKLRLAEVAGIAANLRFPFVNRYMAQVITAADPSLAVLETSDLQFAVFECLREAQADPALAPLRHYTDAGAADVATRELGQFRLSQRIARLLREYAISRPELLAQWRQGGAEPPGLDQGHRWQRHLYRLLFGSGGALRERWAGGGNWLLLPDAFAAGSRAGLAAGLANPLHIFGIAYAGAEFVRMFARMAQHTQVHVYCLNPCLEFWEDVRGGYLASSGLVARGSKLGAGLEGSDDPFAIETPGENLALSFWSRPGREYIRLLNELTECDFEPHFEPPLQAAATGPRLLRLQQAILTRQASLPPAPADGAADRSIRIVAGAGIRREVEIVANEIWSLIRTPAAPDRPALRFHQIAVLVPDGALQVYLPHLRTVCDELHGIPLNLAGQTLSSRHQIAEAIELLVRLPAGNLNRAEMLHLMTHPAMGGGAPDTDSQQWREWCAGLGVYFGADERDLAGTYIPPENYHWEQALRRLALGAFMAGSGSGEGEIYHGAGDREYLPLAVAQDETDGAARLIRRARGLAAEALELRARRCTPAQWSEILRELVSTYLSASDSAGERVLSSFIGALQSIAAGAPPCGPVGYPAACEMALGAFAELQAEMGHFAQSGVVAGAMSALRSLPFRVIFVMGMGEDFPARDARDPLDLRNTQRQAGDVSSNQRDRYLFLESLLAARERLVLSYAARDEVTGEALQPSPLIKELGFLLREEPGAGSLADLTTTHPASRYDRSYFRDLPGGDKREDRNYDPRAHRGARLAALREDLTRHSGGRVPEVPLRELIAHLPGSRQPQLTQALGLIEPDGTGGVARQDGDRVLSLSALRHLLECPLQGVARYTLGMLDEGDDDDEEGEDEPLGQGVLHRVILLREAFWNGRGDVQAVRQQFERALRVYQLRGQTPAGPFFDAVREFGARMVVDYARQARALGLSDLAQWRRIRIGPGDEFTPVDEVLPALTLEVPTRDAKVTRRVSLQGTITVSPDLKTTYRCGAAKLPRAVDFIEGYLAAFALAAAGRSAGSDFSVVVLSRECGERAQAIRRFRPPSQAAARAYLTALARELLYGDHHYFMPVEAVDKIVRADESDPDRVVERIESVRDDDRNGCRSDYGPLRNAREYPAPSGERALEIIERHFGPILSLFEDGAA